MGSVPSQVQSSRPEQYKYCHVHKGQKLNRYCSDHGLILCWVCGGDHKRCRIQSLSAACKTFDLNLEDMLFKNSVRNVRLNLESNLNIVLATKKFDKQMGELKQNIGRVISVFYKEVAQINANILLSNKAVIGDILSNTDAVVNDIQANLTGTHGNPGQLLNLYFRGKTIHEKIQHAVSDNISETTSEISVSTANLVEELQRQLQEYIANTYTLENAIPPPKIHYPFGLKYQHDDDSDYVRHSVSSDIISEPLFPLKLTPFDHFVVRLDTDEKDCFITGLDIMPDGRLILADYDNSKIKVLSQYGVDLSYLTLREEPTDIAVINESEAAVSVNNNKIVVIEIDPHHQISVRQSIILQQGQWADRLAVYENNLVFTCNKYSDENDAIQMMDLNGGAKWNVYANSSDNDKEQIECKLFNEIDFLTVVSGEQEDFVVATDEFKHSITLISAASGELRKVLMFQNKSPFSITAGERANLYVCSKSGEIRSFNVDTGEQTCIVPASNSVEDPFAMLYDSARRRLILTSQSRYNRACDLIHVYSFGDNKPSGASTMA